MLDRSESRLHFPSEMYHHHPQHQAIKKYALSPLPPPCRCCQNRSFSPDLTRKSPNVPKLLRYEQSPSSPNHDLYHQHDLEEEKERKRSVSVIKAQQEDFPIKTPLSRNNNHQPIRRTNSMSSVDQQSLDSHSERSFDSRSPISPFSTQRHFPSEHPPRRQHQHSTEFYRNLQASPLPQPERLRILQDVDQDRTTMKSPFEKLHFRDHHHHHHDQQDYHDIPSPNYPHPPSHHHIRFNPALPRMDRGQHFAFTPYLDANLRHKFADFPDFSIKKRHRTIFTPTQLRQLEEKFDECNFIVGVDRSALAKQLKLKEHQVKIWFQNRRTKVKQQTKEKPTNGEIDVVG